MKPIVKLNSSIDTPKEERIFVLESPEVSRVKVRESDINGEIDTIDREIELKTKRRAELVEIQKEIKKLNK